MKKSYLLISCTAYPLMLIYGYTLCFFLQGFGWSLFASAYFSVATAALIIAWLEFKIPYRRDWFPTSSEVFVDAIFLMLPQLTFSLILKISFLVLLIPVFKENGLTLNHWWPSDWGFWYQFLLMMMVVELFRYCSHRLFHTFSPLWRVHAVHHSITSLYSVSVVRFHPLEKISHFLADTVPLLLLGVHEELALTYLIFYLIHSLFQHGNVDVRLGWLNYIVTGPEVHRWHHSKKIEESNANYGNNLAVWDVIFGTFFWPKKDRVGAIGLVNVNYPMGFRGLIKAPFTTDPNILAVDDAEGDSHTVKKGDVC